MTNRKKLLKALLISALCFVVAALLFYFALPHIVDLLTQPEKSFNKEINSIASESEDIPYIGAYGRLYKDEKVVSLYDLCKMHNLSYENTLCIFKDKAYFICTESDETNHFWSIASINLSSLEIQTHFKFQNPNVAYDKYANSEKYSERNSYYNNGKIVLNDFNSVWEYNLHTNSSKQYGYDEYDFYVSEIYGNTVDDKTIEIHKQNDKKTFTFYEMSEDSIGISTIYSFKDRKMWDGRPYITDFFIENSVQYVNGKIYVIGECKDRTGGAYAVILEYDETQNKWKYITSVYIWNPADKAYIVPEYR